MKKEKERKEETKGEKGWREDGRNELRENFSRLLEARLSQNPQTKKFNSDSLVLKIGELKRMTNLLIYRGKGSASLIITSEQH